MILIFRTVFTFNLQAPVTVCWFSLLASHLCEGTFAGAMHEFMETNVLCWGDLGLHSLDHLYASKSVAEQILQSSLLH